MAQLRRDFDKFAAQETEIVVVGPDNAKAFSEYWQRNDLPFIGLPDPTHTVLKRYGQEVNLFKFGRMPAQVAIDRMGMARFVHYGHNTADIPANEEILDLLKAMNREMHASGQR
jgi:peroxiredoxin Q/BCP